MSVRIAQSSFKAARSPVFSPLYNALMTTSEAAGGSATTDVMVMLRAAGKRAFFPSTNPATGWWQDSAGTTQAVLEQPVGKINDLSGNGYHATQATSLNRPLYTQRVNVFTSTTDTVSTARTGTTFAGAYTLYIGSGSLTLSGTATGTYAAGSHSITCTAGTLTATPSGTVTNLDCRLTAFAAMNLPAYQSVTSSTVYDTAGFRPMLYFDGTSDALATSAIDLTGTDQIMALCNVLKVSDAATGIVYETSTTINSNNGAMYILAPGAAAPTYGIASKGTINAPATSASSFASPNIACLRHDSDISTPVVTLRRNGTQIATSSSSQGTGNYGNHALYIGARAGTSLWFKGYMIPGPLLDTTGIPTALLDQMAREQAALWGVAI
jgi:hypothetical protein